MHKTGSALCARAAADQQLFLGSFVAAGDGCERGRPCCFASAVLIRTRDHLVKLAALLHFRVGINRVSVDAKWSAEGRKTC
jgi:hypothetical protein